MDNRLDFVRWYQPPWWAKLIGWAIGLTALSLGAGLAALVDYLMQPVGSK